MCCYFQEAKPTSCYPSPLAKPTADGAAGLRPAFCPRVPVPDGALCARGGGGRAPVTPPPSHHLAGGCAPCVAAPPGSRAPRRSLPGRAF